MDTSRKASLYRTLISVFVGGALLAQAATIPVTAMHRSILRSKLFPIIEYPMYAYAHYEGERVTGSWLIEGKLDDGNTIQISKEQLGVDIFDFVHLVQGTLDHNPALTRTLLEAIHDRVPGASRIREVRIKSYPLKVTRDGPKAMPSEVVMTLPADPGAIASGSDVPLAADPGADGPGSADPRR